MKRAARKQPVEFKVRPQLSDDDLNELFGRAWPMHETRSFQPVLRRSLGYIAAFDGQHLVGFVNVAGDGGLHAFLLDPTVDPSHQRRGIGSELVRRAAALATEAGCAWLHVDFVPALRSFYKGAGFRPSDAGLLPLADRVRTSC